MKKIKKICFVIVSLLLWTLPLRAEVQDVATAYQLNQKIIESNANPDTLYELRLLQDLVLTVDSGQMTSFEEIRGKIKIFSANESKTLAFQDQHNQKARIFTVNGGTLILENLILRDAGGPEIPTGGAIYIAGESSLELRHVALINNRARNGGAIYADRAVQSILIRRSLLENNHADQGQGGAIFSRSALNNVTETLFLKNQAATGGAFFNDAPFNPQTTLNFVANHFQENKANSGAAIHASSGMDISLQMHLNSFYNNQLLSSEGEGSALYFEASHATSTSVMLNNTIVERTAYHVAANNNSGLFFDFPNQSIIYHNHQRDKLQIGNSVIGGFCLPGTTGQGIKVYEDPQAGSLENASIEPQADDANSPGYLGSNFVAPYTHCLPTLSNGNYSNGTKGVKDLDLMLLQHREIIFPLPAKREARNGSPIIDRAQEAYLRLYPYHNRSLSQDFFSGACARTLFENADGLCDAGAFEYSLGIHNSPGFSSTNTFEPVVLTSTADFINYLPGLPEKRSLLEFWVNHLSSQLTLISAQARNPRDEIVLFGTGLAPSENSYEEGLRPSVDQPGGSSNDITYEDQIERNETPQVDQSGGSTQDIIFDDQFELRRPMNNPSLVDRFGGSTNDMIFDDQYEIRRPNDPSLIDLVGGSEYDVNFDDRFEPRETENTFNLNVDDILAKPRPQSVVGGGRDWSRYFASNEEDSENTETGSNNNNSNNSNSNNTGNNTLENTGGGTQLPPSAANGSNNPADSNDEGTFNSEQNNNAASGGCELAHSQSTKRTPWLILIFGMIFYLKVPFLFALKSRTHK